MGKPAWLHRTAPCPDLQHLGAAGLQTRWSRCRERLLCLLRLCPAHNLAHNTPDLRPRSGSSLPLSCLTPCWEVTPTATHVLSDVPSALYRYSHVKAASSPDSHAAHSRRHAVTGVQIQAQMPSLCYQEAYSGTLGPSEPISDPFELVNNRDPARQSKHEEHQQPKSWVEGLRVKWWEITPSYVDNRAINHKLDIISLSIDHMLLMSDHGRIAQIG